MEKDETVIRTMLWDGVPIVLPEVAIRNAQLRVCEYAESLGDALGLMEILGISPKQLREGKGIEVIKVTDSAWDHNGIYT